MLAGSVLNNRYEILDSDSKSEKSLYPINWKSTKVENGNTKRESKLEVDKKDIQIKKISSEKITTCQGYSVSIDEYLLHHFRQLYFYLIQMMA